MSPCIARTHEGRKPWSQQHVLQLLCDGALVVAVDGSGSAVESAEPVFLFEGHVNGSVAGIILVTCAPGRTFYALDGTGASCVCWVRGVAYSSGMLGNWCPDPTILGIRKGTLNSTSR